jgi:uncharacterized protein
MAVNLFRFSCGKPRRTMRFLISIAIGFSLTSLLASAPHTLTHATIPSKQRVQQSESTSDRDPFCPTKQQRGSSCPGNKPNRCTPLMSAAEKGRLKEVRSLIASGADVNAKLGYGGTALMIAANEGHLEIVKALLAAGADPNSIVATFHAGGFLAWMSALNRCNKNWLEIFDAMLAAGVELNPTTDIFYSPLGYAIGRKDDPVMIEALVKRGANVNIRDSEGETPLMLAVRLSSADVVRVLIGAGADVNARNKKDETVLRIAEKSQNIWQRDIVMMLTNAGAKP